MKPGHGSPGRGNVAFTSPDGSPGLLGTKQTQIGRHLVSGRLLYRQAWSTALCPGLTKISASR